VTPRAAPLPAVDRVVEVDLVASVMVAHSD
jgi:hypothetical protein